MALSSTPQAQGRYKPLAEINVTPLVDVMLVLLIIFMVTMPILTTGLKVNLPKSSSARPLDSKEPMRITITAEGKILIGTDEVERSQFVTQLISQIGNDLMRPIYLRGDTQANFGTIVSVLDELTTHGFSKVALVTTPGPKVR
jgi:biopolymer transport protein TolR